MSSKMQVLFVKQTGHVLSVFTRTSDPEGAPKVKDLTGSGLLIRSDAVVAPAVSGGEEVAVPPESLDVALVDYDPEIFISPLGFVAGGGRVVKLGTGAANVATLAPSGTVPPPPPALPPAALTTPVFTFSTSRVTVQTVIDATDDTGVCVVLQEAPPLQGDKPARRIAQGVIKSGTHFASLDLKATIDGPVASIEVKDFFIMALLAGHQPLFGKRQPAP